MKQRVNPNTGKLEVKLQPEGLPPVWVEVLCDRCEEYKKCLGFNELSPGEWEEVSDLIKATNDLSYLPYRPYNKICRISVSTGNK